VPERQQPWPMISFCYAGAYIATTDDGECVVDRNTLLLLKGSQPYRTRPVSREPSFGASISISPSIAREIAESDRDPIDNLSSSLDPRVRIAEAELFGWLGDPASRPNLAIEERVLQLFASSMSSQRTIAGKAAEHTAAAKAVLAESFRERVSLNQIALRVGISPFHLCRVYRTLAPSVCCQTAAVRGAAVRCEHEMQSLGPRAWPRVRAAQPPDHVFSKMFWSHAIGGEAAPAKREDENEREPGPFDATGTGEAVN